MKDFLKKYGLLNWFNREFTENEKKYFELCFDSNRYVVHREFMSSYYQLLKILVNFPIPGHEDYQSNLTVSVVTKIVRKILDLISEETNDYHLNYEIRNKLVKKIALYDDDPNVKKYVLEYCNDFIDWIYKPKYDVRIYKSEHTNQAFAKLLEYLQKNDIEFIKMCVKEYLYGWHTHSSLQLEDRICKICMDKSKRGIKRRKDYINFMNLNFDYQMAIFYISNPIIWDEILPTPKRTVVTEYVRKNINTFSNKKRTKYLANLEEVNSILDKYHEEKLFFIYYSDNPLFDVKFDLKTNIIKYKYLQNKKELTIFLSNKINHFVDKKNESSIIDYSVESNFTITLDNNNLKMILFKNKEESQFAVLVVDTCDRKKYIITNVMKEKPFPIFK